MNRLDYCQYLLSNQTNYTLTYFADHVDSLSHDKVNRYLRGEKLSSRLIWQHVKSHIVPCEEGYLLFDDTVLDKKILQQNRICSQSVQWQYT